MDWIELPRERTPLALWELHRSLEVGADVEIKDPSCGEPELRDLLVGGGFSVQSVHFANGATHVEATRERSLADTVAPGLRLLMCGLNPSLYAADKGVGFARPGNRFWPAAIDAGLVTRDRDALNAVHAHRIGMTDLCKRATVASAELTVAEYRDGATRVERLVGWLQPRAICFVGLEGWRKAIDNRAKPGVQERGFGGRPAYLMPSTSGLNANAHLEDLVGHLRAAAALAESAD